MVVLILRTNALDRLAYALAPTPSPTIVMTGVSLYPDPAEIISIPITRPALLIFATNSAATVLSPVITTAGSKV